MRAVTYSRFSTDRQTDSSIADQVRVCTEHAERQGWQVVERFEDQGISGAALGNRPGVLRMQEAALGRRFDVLLVTDLSRLSRSQGDLSKMIDRLVAKGLRVIGVQDGYDSARRGHKLQAGLSGIIGEAFREMVKDRTYAALESRARDGRSAGGRAYGYIPPALSGTGSTQIDQVQAQIVREIFGRFADGESCQEIAADLNARGLPSPGSTWKRTTRRCTGWAGSSVRVILRNPRYAGRVHWNQSEWRKDPDTGKRLRVGRPRSEWITRTDETQRIVSDELWERAQRRPPPGDLRTRSGGVLPGKQRYLLSGLLRCGTCGAHYTLVAKNYYGCSSHHDGKACSNSVRIRRDRTEAMLLEEVRELLDSPERIGLMATEMQRYYAERVQAMQTQATERPRELAELDARIARLRERLKAGDPDLPADELQAAIDRVDQKRRELEQQQPQARASAKVLSMLPRAAEHCRRWITLALSGDQRAVLKTKAFLRHWFTGKIRLEPLPDGGLMAHWNEDRQAVLLALGASGSGGRI